MKNHRSKKIILKNIEPKQKLLDESFRINTNPKKLNEEEEKNELLKISKKWELEEQKDIQKMLKSMENNKRIKLDKINISFNEERNAIKEEINYTDNKSEYDGNNQNQQEENNLTEEESLEKKFNSIKEKASSFLNGGKANLQERFRYTMEVNKYISEEINYNQNKFPDKLLSPDKAVSDENFLINFLGYWGSELSLYRIRALIEKEGSNELIRDITFKMILTGLATQRVYKIAVNSDEEKKVFHKDIREWYNLIQKIKNKIVSTLKMDKSELHFFNHDPKNYEVLLIIYNKRLNTIDSLLKPFPVDLSIGNLLNNVILSPNMFVPSFCRNLKDWPKGGDLVRGREKYLPPYGWIGIALKIGNKFGKDNEWFGKDGKNEKEWCVAYHGIGRGNELDKVYSIIQTNLRKGPKQRFSGYRNTRKASMNKYELCQKGVYLTPDISKAEKYAGKTKLGVYSKEFQFAIQARVDPNKIRDPGYFPVNWILNGGNEEIRPYRLLVKMS